MSDEARRVVCFDLGGVLVRICRSWAEACARAGLPERNAAWFASDAWGQRRRTIGDRYQRGELACDAYHAELVSANDGHYTELELRAIHDAWTLEEYPGALGLVQALNALPGVQTACLSNTNHGHWVRLANLDGRAEYPAVQALRLQLASHMLGCAKPDPRIYALAQARFAAPDERAPEQVVFFDDLAENVAAARAAGWHAVLVDPLGDTVQQMRRALGNAGVPV